MNTLLAEVARILEDEFQVPRQLHKKIVEKWVRGFLLAANSLKNRN